MYGSGVNGLTDGFEIGSKRPRMMEPNPYFAPNHHHPYDYTTTQSQFHPSTFPVIRLRGLPFNCTDLDIFKFFSGLEIIDILLVTKTGRFSGEAFVLFSRPMQADLALQKDRQNMGRRYIEVFKGKKQDYYNAVASEVKHEGYVYDNDSYHHEPVSASRSGARVSKRGVGQDFKDKDKDRMEYTEILKLRGLPFSVKKTDVVEFFKDFKVVDGKVHIACRPDGKATGEAYVEFVSVEEAKRAMSRDKMMIGSRYVELFPSTTDEARRAESRSRQ